MTSRRKFVLFISSLLILSLQSTAFAQALSQDQIEAKVRADLETTLSKLLDPELFAVQVGAAVDRVNERQVVEGEQVTASQPKAVEVAPLPGFDPEPVRADSSSGSTRQVYRMVEKQILRSLQVGLLIDPSVDQQTSASAESLVRNYLSGTYPNQYRLNLQRVAFRKHDQAGWSSSIARSDVLAGIGAILLAGLAFVLLRMSKNVRGLMNPNTSANYTPNYRTVNGLDVPRLGGDRMTDDDYATTAVSALPPGRGEANRERTAFAGVPANTQYADHRRELLDAFLKSASEFRLYFEKLDQPARSELCAALNGPAFSTLLESLKLENDATAVTPPGEEQLKFYLKNFLEFHEALNWQDRQFFGFLPHLTEEQLTALVQSQSPVVGALILKFTKAEVSASILDRINENLRHEIIDQFDRTREMSPDELKTIEQTARDSVRLLPNFILSTDRQEIEYWTRLLAVTPDPIKLLSSLERSRPDLYGKLARFRFQLEDLPSLPIPLIRKVVDEIENDDLARALSRQSRPLVDYALSDLPDIRRRLLESQIASYQNVDTVEVRKSVDVLTRKFREVIA